MEQEFTISIGWKIFYSIIAVVMALFALFLFGTKAPDVNTAVLLLPILIFISAVLLIVSLFRKKVIISAEKIVLITTFSTKELLTADIKGVRIGEKVIYIEPISSLNPKITIRNWPDMGDADDLAAWLRENFTDLNATDLKAERDKAFEDAGLGSNPQEREERIKKATQIAWAYNITGMVLGFALIFCENDLIAALLAIFFPLLGILIMIFSKGLTKFVSNSKRSVYSFTILGFFLPAFIMLIKSLSQYEIAQYQRIWLPFLSVGIVITLLLYLIGINKSIASIPGQIIIMIVAGLIYGYGCTIQINCVFDKSVPQLIHSSVYNKWIEHNKGTYYHLRLNSWYSEQKLKDIEVSRSNYNKYADGDKIDVNVKKGFLNIPWYYLAD